MKPPRVENMIDNSGREIPNQFKIYTGDGVYFQYRDSPLTGRDSVVPMKFMNILDRARPQDGQRPSKALQNHRFCAVQVQDAR